MPPVGEDGHQRSILLFNIGKNELFSPTNGYKTLTRKVRGTWKIGTLKEEIYKEKLSAARVVAFGGPRAKFTASEVGPKVYEYESVACFSDEYPSPASLRP